MKAILSILTATLFVFLTMDLNAQNCDPWIVQAYQQLYNRKPSAEECKISNYNRGSWNNYNELVNYIKAFNASKGSTKAVVKGDPWIFQIYKELYNRTPNAWEVNINNYNNGSWNSYADLKKYVSQFQTSLQKASLLIKTTSAPDNNSYVIFEKNGKVEAIDLVSLDGGKVVAAGGANVVSAGGANVVAAGGMNLQITNNMAGVSFGNKYSVQSAGTTIVPTSGAGALIIR